MTRKKLIEVSLPLEAINEASAREKSIRHGHPSTLHLWWARRPLAAARAVIFAQMVDDPGSWPELFPTEKKQQKERERLFRIIEDLVKWENTNNEEVLNAAREEIWQSWRRACAENADHPQAKELFDRNTLPAFHDPFAGGGALPLEAQRLGLESYASDLNPIPVLINKSLIEIPYNFSGKPPVNPEARNKKELFEKRWDGAKGIAEDVRYYGEWIRREAEKRIGNLYPKVKVTAEMIKDRQDLNPYLGKELTVIAWIWARTVKSPNPAFSDTYVPLASTFLLSSKAGKEAYIEPIIERSGYRFEVRLGKPTNYISVKSGTKLARGANFECLMSKTPISSEYIKAEGKAGRINTRLMAIVAEGNRGRIYLAPTQEHEKAAFNSKPSWKPELTISGSTQYLGVKPYGMNRFDQLFTDRQLVALNTLSDLVSEVINQIRSDSISAGLSNDPTHLYEGGTGATAFSEAVSVYLSFAIDRIAMTGNSLVRWNSVGEKAQHCFGRQALSMLWDFAEPNFLASSTGSIDSAIFYSYDPLNYMKPIAKGVVVQSDAAVQNISRNKIISTDPPYYDNVPYADLSDFFYVWLRRTLKNVFPTLFQTLGVPKEEELVAFAHRHEAGKTGAEKFFLSGMTKAMRQLSEQSHPAFPISIYYAFKQSESDSDAGTASTGWETFLDAIVSAGFSISGTWPTRTELANRMRGMDSNALASSIVLVCNKRTETSTNTSRREFLNMLKEELPRAVRRLQEGNIAPVDLAQASIGPGMAIFTRYSQVLDAEGIALSVREAMVLINQVLDETLSEQEGDFDADTRFALTWFEQQGFEEGEFGVADVLARAKGTSVQGMVEAGILHSGRGKVRLLKSAELPANWNPEKDERLTVWECVHHIIKQLKAGGETAAADLVNQLASKADTARELAYRLYSICERKKRAQDAMAYNDLVQSWPEIQRIAQEPRKKETTQTDLFNEQ
jgi:putative DNA methylase